MLESANMKRTKKLFEFSGQKYTVEFKGKIVAIFGAKIKFFRIKWDMFDDFQTVYLT